MTTETTTPKVWIGCLAAYNNGHLHGEWVDAAVEEDEIWEAQRRVLASSPIPRAEEHFIADYEGFGPYRVEEYDSLTRVAMIARLIDEHGLAFAAWLAHDDEEGDEHELVERFRDEHRGEWDSEEEFARDQVGDIGLPGIGFVYPERGPWPYGTERPKWGDVLDDLDHYLDWDAITRATMEDYHTIELDGKTLVFEAR